MDPVLLKRRREEARERLLSALRAGSALREAAAMAGMSVSTAGRWARQSGVALNTAAPPRPPRRGGQRHCRDGGAA